MKYRLAATVRVARVDDATFILDIRRGEYYGLDRASAALWLEILSGDAEASAAKASLNAALQRGWLVPAETPSAATADSGYTKSAVSLSSLGFVVHR